MLVRVGSLNPVAVQQGETARVHRPRGAAADARDQLPRIVQLGLCDFVDPRLSAVVSRAAKGKNKTD